MNASACGCDPGASWRCRDFPDCEYGRIRVCADGKHYFDPDRDDGDSCRCGSFYLSVDKDGFAVVQS